MKALKFQIRNLSPLILSSKTADPNIVSTFDHIPGTTLHGLFANEYLRIRKPQGSADTDEKFNQWFNRGALKFLNAYPADVDSTSTRQYYPLPLALQREKHGSTVYNLFFNQNSQQNTTDTKAIDSYGYIEDDKIYPTSVRKNLNFHHKRDRTRGVTEQGIIFNYESIEPFQNFVGLILGDSDNLNEFRQTFKEGQYRIGRSRHAQYGLVEFKYLSTEPEDYLTLIEDDENLYDENEAILYLVSDTVILNKFGFSTVNLETFEAVTGLRVKKSIIRASTEEGYRSVWKARTPSYVCFKAGSCFLVELNQQAKQRLRELLLQGIGEFTNLGFGRLRLISNQNEIYHLSESKTKQTLKSDKPTSVSETAKRLILHTIENALLEQIQSEAIDRANQFTRGTLPPSSLVSKLIEATSQGKLKEKLHHISDKSSRAKLERINDGENTLYDFLISHRVTATETLEKLPELKKIQSDLSISIQDLDRVLENKFFTTFLTVLRTRIKVGGKDA